MKKPAPSLTAIVIVLLTVLSIGADPVDDLLQEEIRKRHIPGLSVAVVHDGKVVKTAAYGLANLELNVPVKPKTVFQIQSITKTFTSTAILLLAQEGKLSLDDSISQHLDESPESWQDITIRHLLNHTSGIKDFINEPTANLRIEVTEEEVLKATAPRPLNFAPGEQYAYSNTNYHLLAMIIRVHTGKGYGDFLKERLINPLGMSSTRIYSHADIIPHRASGYGWRPVPGYLNGQFIAESILSYAGGGMLSTAPDMAQWALAMMDAKVLEQKNIDRAWQRTQLKHGRFSNYGLGWAIRTINGHREVNHNGGHSSGFSSSLMLYPDDRLAVMILTNRSNVKAARIARKVAGLYIPALTPKPETPIADTEPETTAFLRKVIATTITSGLEAKWFTPELWQGLESQKGDIQTQARAYGKLESLELLSRSGSRDNRKSRYRATFANGVLIITLTLNQEGKITNLQSEEE